MNGIKIVRAENTETKERGIKIVRADNVKKKDETEVSTSIQEDTDGTLDTGLGGLEKPSESSVIEGKTYTNYPGKESNQYKLIDGEWMWREKSTSKMPNLLTVNSRSKSGYGAWNKIENAGRIDALNNYYGKKATPKQKSRIPKEKYVAPKTVENADTNIEVVTGIKLNQEEEEALKGNKVFTNYPGKGSSEYYTKDGEWYKRSETGDGSFVKLESQGSVDGLNKYFLSPEARTANEILHAYQYSINESGAPELSDYEKKKLKYSSERKQYLEGVDDVLIGKEEEEVVKTLQDRYAEDGFTFEESGAGDAMIVKSLYGDKIKIDLDPYRSSTEQLMAGELRNFLWDNKTTGKVSYEGIIDKLKSGKVAISEEYKAAADAILNNKLDVANKTQLELFKKKNELEGLYLKQGFLTPEQSAMEEQVLELYNKSRLTKEEVEKTKSQIDVSAGLAIENVKNRNELMGSTAGALGNSVLKGVEQIVSGAGTLVTTIADTIDESLSMARYGVYGDIFGGEFNTVEFASDIEGYEKREKSRKETIKNIQSKTKDMLVDRFGSATMDEYIASEDRSTLMKAAMGVTQSAPAMITGFGGMFLQSFNSVAEEWVDNPDYEEMPLSDLMIVGGSIAVIQGALEKAGLSTLLSKSPIGKTLTNKIVQKAYSKITGKVTQKKFNDLIKAETNSMITNGVIKVVGGAITEGETGALQEIADIGIKTAYNKVKGESIFEAPETLYGAVSQITEAAKMEAIGGALMKGAFISPKIIKSGISNAKVSSEVADALHYMSDSPELKKSLVKKLKVSILEGRITKTEAENIVNDFEKVNEVMREIPSKTKDKSRAFDLLIEKKRIENEIEGKDKNLVTKQQERINEINTELQLNKPKEKEEVFKAKDGVRATPKSDIGVSAADVHNKEGGSSVSQSGENLFGKPGYSVSTHTDKTKIIKGKEVTNEELEQYKEDNKEALEDPNNFVGTWYDSKSDQTYIDIATRVENKQEAIELGKANNQKAIFDLESGDVIDTGGTGEAEVKTKPVKQEKAEIKQGLTQPSTTESLKAKFKEVKGERKQKVIRAAHNITKALKGAPDVKIYVHESTDAYNSAIAKSTGESKESIDAESQKSLGEYISGKGEIHINLENESTDATTVYHEAFHAVFEAKGVESGAAKEMVDGLKKIAKDKKLIDRIDKFVSSYETGEQSEEFMAEITGILSDAAQTLDANGLHRLINLINKIATKIIGGPIFKATASRQEVLDFINKTTANFVTGEEIEIEHGAVTTITAPIRKSQLEPVIVKDNHKLSLVSKDDLMDIESLVKEISEKGQKVWFWVADQLGRGMYFDSVTGKDHFLDAGPSYSLDPENRKSNIIWASGMPRKSIESRINDSDYIFIMSGSPDKSKLFNQKVSGLIKERIESNVSFDTFKRNILKAKPVKTIAEILNKYNSFGEIFSGKDRKKFILAINEQGKKNTETSKLLNKYDAIVDPNDLRDGFYADNNFQQGDVMMVLKPTKAGGKSKHSTYETDVLGEVIGVPDKKVNAFDIMPEDFKAKYETEMNRAMQSQAVAPYGVGVREVAPNKRKKRVLPKEVSDKLTEDKNGNYIFENFGRDKVSVIKPGLTTGAGTQTSKEEISAINSVGGMTQLYTMEGQTESFVGPEKRTVAVPKDKVYDFNSDPDNFFDDAKEQFSKARPGLAFSPNYQVAWVTKIANENGYDLTVAKWRGNELRAQTTKDLNVSKETVLLKPREENVYKVGDDVIVYGVPAKITKVSGDIVSFEGNGSSGEVNVARSKRSIRKKRKIRPANDINKRVTAMKAEGMKNNDIRAQLKSEMFTDKQASAAILEYDVKKEGIFLKKDGSRSEKIMNTIKSLRLRLLTARKHMPKSVFKAYEKSEAEIAAQLNKAHKLTVDFSRFYKRYEGDKEALKENFNDYIRGDKDAKIPKELRAIADQMRSHVDQLSIVLRDSGVVDEETAETITANIGQYMHRSYKVFDRKNWKDEVSEVAMTKARKFIRAQSINEAEEEALKQDKPFEDVIENIVDRKIDEILTEDIGAFQKRSKMGAKDIKVFKEKQDIPEEIRALMGEYTDPNLVYARTIMKTATIAAHHKFLSRIKDTGAGVFLFNEKDVRPVEFNHKISAEGNEAMAPLDGMYTTEEIMNEFNSQFQETGKLIEIWMKGVSAIKWAKTIGSVATHAKNVIGNLSFLALNGHVNVRDFGMAYKTVQADFRSRNKQDLRNRMNHYISLGIVKQSAGLGEIRDMFKDANWDSALADRLSMDKVGMIAKIKRFALRQKKVLEDTYQAEDDFFKIIAFESERTRYAKALYGKEVSELTTDEKVEIDEKASSIVKDTLPTYSRVPEIIQKFRRSPLIGSFVAFTAESYRTGANTAVLAASELKNPDTRSIGVKRMIGATAYMSAKTAILSYGSYAAGAGVTGIYGALTNSDEEKEKDSDLRRFLPEWSLDSDLYYSNVGDGKFTYIDVSAADPWGAFNKVINAAINEDGITDGVIESSKALIEPFVGTEIATDAALQLQNNTDGYGKPIYNTTDSKFDQVNDIVAFLTKVVEPGTVSSIRRIARADNKTAEVIAAVTGYRSRTVDVNEQAGYAIRDIIPDISLAKKGYNSNVRKFENGEITKDDLEQSYKKANKNIIGIYSEIKEVYDSAVRLGVDPAVMEKTMKGSQMSKDLVRQIMTGNLTGIKRKI